MHIRVSAAVYSPTGRKRQKAAEGRNATGNANLVSRNVQGAGCSPSQRLKYLDRETQQTKRKYDAYSTPSTLL